jgi:hypothetical protein
MSSSNSSRASKSARNAKAIAGIQKRLATVPSILLDGISYTPVSLVALFQSEIDSEANVSATRAAWTVAVSDDTALAKKVDATYTALQVVVRNMFANAVDVLADFGMAPKKSTKSTLLTKVVASEKRIKTRGARQTMGKKERLAISGDATASEIAASVAQKIAPNAPVLPAPQPTASHPAEPVASLVVPPSPGNGGGRTA